MKTYSCKDCPEYHDLYYFRMINGQDVLSYTCPRTKKYHMVPYVGFLDIPVKLSKKLLRKIKPEKVEAEQMPLSLLGVSSS